MSFYDRPILYRPKPSRHITVHWTNAGNCGIKLPIASRRTSKFVAPVPKAMQMGVQGSLDLETYDDNAIINENGDGHNLPFLATE